ncbi:hypothetical protein FKP32DRAFT_1140812 [Trametes sanguinea]|nr:hypothetical protein FKP32DRAFT_1140812 [Trametes sanguinea]
MAFWLIQTRIVRHTPHGRPRLLGDRNVEPKRSPTFISVSAWNPIRNVGRHLDGDDLFHPHCPARMRMLKHVSQPPTSQRSLLSGWAALAHERVEQHSMRTLRQANAAHVSCYWLFSLRSRAVYSSHVVPSGRLEASSRTSNFSRLPWMVTAFAP